MNLAASILGRHAVDKLSETRAAAVLTIGSDTFTRGDLAHVECFNFHAARILSHVFNRELQVKNLRQVFDEIPPSALSLPNLGVICLAVLGAAFEARGIGGSEPLVNYLKKHAEKIQTFHTIKAHAQAEERRARKDARARTARRRATAHKLRTTRFEDRQQAV